MRLHKIGPRGAMHATNDPLQSRLVLPSIHRPLTWISLFRLLFSPERLTAGNTGYDSLREKMGAQGHGQLNGGAGCKDDTAKNAFKDLASRFLAAQAAVDRELPWRSHYHQSSI